MPYGEKYDLIPVARVTDVNLHPSGSQANTSVFDNNYMSYKLKRSGTNRNAQLRGKELPTMTGYELQPEVVKDAPKLGQKVWDSKTKKWVWKKAPLLAFRLKPRFKSSKLAKGMDLTPNDLSFTETRLATFGAQNISASAGGGWSRTISGDLWCPFIPKWAQSYPGEAGFSPGNYSTITSSLTNLESALDAKVLSMLYERVKDQHVNLAQALAESRQTTSMMADAVTRVAQALRSLRRGNLADAAKHIFPTNSKELANDWLILQYGIKPLLSDIKGAFTHLTTNRTMQFDVIASKTENLSARKISEKGVNIAYKGKHELWTEGEITVKYKARVEIISDFDRHRAQLGFTNPASLAWELTPYSFVVDWALPIGNYLNNLDAFHSLRLVYVTKTVFYKERTWTRSTCGGYAGSYSWTPASWGWEQEKVQCTRSLLSIVPPLPFPSFKDPVSMMHLANAAALLRQLMR